MRCSKNYEKGKCELQDTDPKEKLTCANCGETGHPASYKGCKYMKHVKSIVKSTEVKNRGNKVSKLTQIVNKVNPQRSYAQVARPSQHNRPRFNSNKNSQARFNSYNPHQNNVGQPQNSNQKSFDDMLLKMQESLTNSFKELLGPIINQISELKARSDEMYNKIFPAQ